MKELIKLRKRREKHFLNSDGTITAYMYNHDVHCKKNGKWEEIDNTLIDKGTYFENKLNSFNTIFTKNSKDLVNIKKDSYYLKMSCKNHINLVIDKKNEQINYKNTKDNIDFIYELKNNKLKESIILNCRETIPDFLDFVVDTNLALKLDNNKRIEALNENNDIIFIIDAPYMLDAANKRNDNIFYSIEKQDLGYIVKLSLDKDWLADVNTYYPVVIDPTIINGTGDNVSDAFISSNDPNRVFDGVSYLKIGSTNEGVFRTLLKFQLPTIATGCSIVSATAFLRTQRYLLNGTFSYKAITVHNINQNWDEKTVTWNNINDKFDALNETYFNPVGYSGIDASVTAESEIDLTNIVKKWYAGLENNGVMLKLNDETPDSELSYYTAYSKTYDYNNGTAERPYLMITYLYQNGILPYMDYNEIDFSTGKSQINNCNGNVTNTFRLNRIVNSKFPFCVSAVYNSCDVILNNVNNIGKGWKLNFYETIKEDTVGGINTLVYVDEYSSIHYFYQDSSGIYCDEEGLMLKITKSDLDCTLVDNVGNKKIFNKMANEYRLVKIIDISNNTIEISYEENKIITIKNDDDIINFSYPTNKIIISSSYDISTINLNNNEQIETIQNKFGIVKFEYAGNNLISKIEDINNISFNYEYYSMIPYRIKKISTYGKNNVCLKSLNYIYGFNTTSIIDSNDMKKVYSFNNKGNTIGTVVYNNSTKDISDAYGYSKDYVDDYLYPQKANNVSSETKPIKYIKNLIEDSSFENSDLNSFDCFRTLNKPRTGQFSCYVDGEYNYTYDISKDNYYTFSFYIKSEYTGNVILYKDNGSEVVELEKKDMLENNLIYYSRYFVTGYFESGTKLKVKIKLVNIKSDISLMDHESSGEEDLKGFGFIDDLQLEEGKVANLYNLVDNSNFSNGFTGWNLNGTVEIVTLENGIKVARIKGDPDNSSSLTKPLNISGKAGDVYNLSFWYKNEGVLNTGFEFMGNMANLLFSPVDEDLGGGTFNLHLNNHASEWQFFNGTFVADFDYSNIYLNIISSMEVNSIYLTNVMLVQSLESSSYVYDSNNNPCEIYESSDQKIINTYDNNNQLTSYTDKNGRKYKYEYDNVINNRVLSGISPSGFTVKNIYDNNGKKVKEVITNTIINGEVKENNKYNIRLKGTNKYLKYDYNNKKLTCDIDYCNHKYYSLEKDNEYYRLKFENKNIIFNDTGLTLADSSDSSSKSLFEIIKNDNASITIKPKDSSGKVLTYSNDTFILNEFVKGLYTQQFYFENASENKKIITETIYDDEGKFINKSIDSLGKITKYTTDNNTGLVTSITNPKGVTTNKYYSNDLLIKETLHSREINYEYNTSNLLSKLILDNKIYQFIYDEMMRTKEIKLNDNIIVSKEYDSNNNVTKTMFSNNNQIEYNYDKFGRVESINKSGKQYNYYYDNMGALAKVETANEVYDYNYNLLQKLYKFIYNNEFISKYTYDLNGNLNHRKVLMDNKEYDIEYLYNKDDNPTKITIENNNINIEYDDLGRIIKQDVNGNIPLEITYMSNGENTSLNIETVKINNKLFKFKYDDCYNITEIYINENIVKKYKYDDINELILEIDYNVNQKIKYRYDKNGNILSKMICSLDDVLLSQDNFEYNNINWKDQLTKFNDEEITYDNLGNPLSFGNKSYTWINGTQLKSFSDDKKTIDYEYNHLGQMISKKIGNTITKYYYESSLLTLEKRNNNVIYFIYNSDEKLVGFKYNDELYYYQMNHLNDITGIYDSNYNLVVSYSYDSWGNILSITDSLGNEVTDPSHIGVINPFRFRSYYYDEDIKMYCFQERYYNPSICRFFNIDSQIGNDFLGSNLYVYCGNNPINRSDDEGKGFFSAFIAGMAIGAVIKITSNIIQKKPVTDGLVSAVIEGGVAAALATTRLGLLGSSLLVSSVKNIGKESYKYGTGKTKVTKKNVISSTSTIVVNAVTDTGLSAMGGALSYKVARSLGIVDVGRPAKKFMVQLLGKKAMKNYFKDIISGAYSETVNSLLDYNHNIVQSKVTDLF